MLTSVCRQGHVPEDLDKPLRTRKNRPIGWKSAERHMLTSIPNS